MNHKDSGNENSLEQEFQGYAQLLTTAEAVAQQQGDVKMAIELYQLMTVLKNGGDTLKQLSQYKDEVEDVQKQGEFMRIIGKLNLELASAEVALAQKIREIQSLEEKVLELEKEKKELKTPSIKLVKKGKLTFQEGSDVAVCPNCHKNSSRVVEMGNVMDMVYTCPDCGLKIIDH